MLRHTSLSSVLIVLSSFILLTAVGSISVGPMNISFIDSLMSVATHSNQLPDHIHMVIHEIRLPRTLLCILVGAILAVCGTVTQGLFRNPLAEPGIIGVSAGASLGGAVAIVLFSEYNSDYPNVINIIAVPLFAFLGAIVATGFVYRLGTNKLGTSVTIMLLAGVAITALSFASLGYMNFIANDQMLRDISLWQMGSLAGASWTSILLCATTLFVLLVCFTRNAMPLNALLLGEAEAAHLGIPVQKLKRLLMLLTAIGVGVAVSVSGMIGFIGLIIPHLGRMLCGPDHRSLVPISACLGALLLTITDMISRTVLAPAELPVGIVTAMIGSPFFIYLLFKQRGKIF
ncbi:iron chelate uptake ABC transporter family permease subunit [Vibrio sp. OCN044]|uniref:Iron chelate uptake ABC transporter family permease subunit n=1 Tax=Vibrio tetraodonis subsp. pristinus TaxID=2695891 RepID=A0A6L8LV08_9VIBR|nr:iron ABC transporter permease [Vibrio tetraodonis]MYM59036.1 iron chelate uptake ABC transporter family permease subunit [Vibrio tetraodonis subsp. pristinus]